MDWTSHLESGEFLRWEGRPAPRCFTFRRWRHSLFGFLLLALSIYWQFVGYQLSATYRLWYLAWIPLPFLAVGLYLFVGHLLVARREWEHVFYAITDRRLLVQKGLFRRRRESVPLGAITYFRISPLGETLGTVRIWAEGEAASIEVPCLEYPRRMTDLLEAAMGDKIVTREG